MKLRELLKEEWKDSFKYKGATIEVFKNPSAKELSSISSEPKNLRYKTSSKVVRFFAYKGNVYAFPPFILHHEVVKNLGLPSTITTDLDNYFEGIATMKNGKWTNIESHLLDSLMSKWEEGRVGALKEIKEKLPMIINKFKYVNKYIDNKDYFNNLLNKFGKQRGFKKFSTELRKQL